MADTPAICRFCGTKLVWGWSMASQRWVSLEPDPEGTWVRGEKKSCWKLEPGEETHLPRYLPHRPLCARRVKAKSPLPPPPPPKPQGELF